MAVPEPRDAYRLVDRTLVVTSVMCTVQYHTIVALLERRIDSAARAPHPARFEITNDPAAGRVLAYVREQELRHAVIDEYRWTGTPVSLG